MNGNLVVDLHNNEKQVIFDFPRSSKEKHLCLTDYFGENDIVAFQAVTVGNKVTEVLDEWNKDNMYTVAYYLHVLAVETADAFDEWFILRFKTEV
jgi:5-methyltetrahydrofolate--homocysteine methyltransferase